MNRGWLPCTLAGLSLAALLAGTIGGSSPLSVAWADDFQRADVDGNGAFNGLVDGIFLFNWLINLGTGPDCLDAADVNDDSALNLADVVHALYFQFGGGFPPPPEPFGFCGADPTADSLDCDSYLPCGP